MLTLGFREIPQLLEGGKKEEVEQLHCHTCAFF